MAVIYTYKNLFFYKFSTKIIKYIIVIFAIFFIDLIYQFIFTENILGFKAGMCNMYNECSRFSSFFNDEYIAGGYITLIIIPFFLLINKIYKKKYLMLVPITILIFVIITGERTSTILALLFNIFYYSITIKSVRNKLLFFIFLILGLIIFVNLLLPEKTTNRYKSEIIKMSFDDNGDFTFFYNNPWILHYEASVKIFMDKPFIGHGHKAFKKKCKKYEYLKEKYSNNYNVCTTHPHNLFLEVLVDTGLLGFLPFVIFFILLVYSNINKLKNPQYKLILIYLMIIIFLPRPTGSIFSTYFLNMFIYSIGLLTGIMNTKKNYKNE
jgi:O-antigen ligase